MRTWNVLFRGSSSTVIPRIIKRMRKRKEKEKEKRKRKGIDLDPSKLGIAWSPPEKRSPLLSASPVVVSKTIWKMRMREERRGGYCELVKQEKTVPFWIFSFSFLTLFFYQKGFIGERQKQQHTPHSTLHTPRPREQERSRFNKGKATLPFDFTNPTKPPFFSL